MFDFLRQTELEASSVAALQRKYGVWRKRFKKVNNFCGLRTSTHISALFSKLRTHCKYVVAMNELPLTCSAALQTIMYRNKTLRWKFKGDFFQYSNPVNGLWFSDASWLNVSLVNNKCYFYIHVWIWEKSEQLRPYVYSEVNKHESSWSHTICICENCVKFQKFSVTLNATQRYNLVSVSALDASICKLSTANLTKTDWTMENQ